MKILNVAVLVAVLGVARMVMGQGVVGGVVGDGVPASEVAAGGAVGVGGAGGVPVQRVTLYSSGVGYFEHAGTVKGDGEVGLRFKQGQINDVLKSLVAQDLNGGKVGGVNYGSQEGLDRRLRSFGVDLSGAPGVGALLGQLRGARVTLEGSRVVRGMILGVEMKQVGQGQAVVERWVVNVADEKGAIDSVMLDEVRSVKLEDKELQAELVKALTALAGARDQEKKVVTVKFTGDGERKVKIGYVVETPVWKTSYRLILGDKPTIQGWAIVENQTDWDWKDVDLGLVSGKPISFVQDLYSPRYIERPVVVAEGGGSVRPQEYAAGMADKREVAANGPMSGAGAGGGGGAGGFGGGGGRGGGAQLRARAAMPPAAPMAMAQAAQSEEMRKESLDASSSVAAMGSGEKMGELFEYRVGHVSLPRQTSAMIPIVAEPVEAEKVSIYNQNVLSRNPLYGVRVKNVTGKVWLGGPVTVIEGGGNAGAGYVGDARVETVPVGQERMLAYGVDLQTLVDAAKRSGTSEVRGASLSKGVLTLVNRVVQTQEYVIENKGDAEKTIVVEHPRQGGGGVDWKLVETPEPSERTDAVYRFKVKVGAGKTEKLTVKEETVQRSGMVLINFEVDDFLRYAQTGAVPDKVKAALEKAAAMKRSLVESDRGLQEKKEQLAAIAQEQNRIRENLRTVNQNSDYGQRLVKKLGEQETQVEGIQEAIGKLSDEVREKQKALGDYLAGLEL